MKVSRPYFSTSPQGAREKFGLGTRLMVASFPGPLREFRTVSDERAGPGNEARLMAHRWGRTSSRALRYLMACSSAVHFILVSCPDPTLSRELAGWGLGTRLRSFFKFGWWSRRRSSLFRTTMRISACCNSALLLAEK